MKTPLAENTGPRFCGICCLTDDDVKRHATHTTIRKKTGGGHINRLKAALKNPKATLLE